MTSYTTREGVVLTVKGEKVAQLRVFLMTNQIMPIGGFSGSPDYLTAVFTPHDAKRVIGWMTDNYITDEDYAADLRAESGA